ncbi:DUF692 domain-containing protein [Permianibacter aggregans]|uniref:UPF0276 protein EV696_101162 n=1 Tax=Permianibacter aggregans TaxID=1510150 RepID=A0A4R6UVD4_9GAMM|nr:DUF692 domain-containing protein [Permianibacter aggregans]QGX41403.1 DUF692 domain-containing protein [Permianibacter aggregans]TDQ51192.1 hypothetical protein EV696_101162 [Permianibacter aggregans]
MRYPVEGVGLGLRRELMQPLRDEPIPEISFLEVAPENWMRMGGALGKRFRAFTERYPFVCHGLSLSIGSPAPLDEAFVLEVRTFLRSHNIRKYSEHLSYCSDHGHLYDLMPIPFTEEAVDYVAARIRRVQDLLGQRIAIENVSYYAAPGQEMPELEFLLAVLKAADCELLLDVNNIYVNSVNHRYDALEFLRGLQGAPVSYVHIAGHYDEAPDLLVDTHGTQVKPSVWALLEEAYRLFGVMPTLLERDFNIPSLPELQHELQQIEQLQEQAREFSLRQTASAG